MAACNFTEDDVSKIVGETLFTSTTNFINAISSLNPSDTCKTCIEKAGISVNLPNCFTDDEGMSTLTLILIIVGSVLGGLVLMYAVYYIYFRKPATVAATAAVN